MSRSDRKAPDAPQWAARAVRRAVEKYDVAMKSDRARLKDVADRNAPTPLNDLVRKVSPQEQQRRWEALEALRAELVPQAVEIRKQRLMEALAAGFDDGSLPPPETVLAFEIELPADFHADFPFYERQLAQLEKRVQHMGWRDKQRAIIEEIRALNALEGWRAKNPMVAAFFVQVLVSFLARGPGKRGRKPNQTALSDERRLVNDYLPWLRGVQKANGVEFKRREEIALLCRLARAKGILTELDDKALSAALTRAVKNWGDTNGRAPGRGVRAE